ncbi:MAG: glycosyltransferase [Allobaculum sp.]|nr:glycosyltransferase [Allobaculum sp.]
MERLNICAVIVTFNRKELLARCLTAVYNQTYPLSSIVIVDNASSDGTYEYLCQEGLISKRSISNFNPIDVSVVNHNVIYYRLTTNEGGAGGFYSGLKLAHQSMKFNAYWLMDDDGYPSECCLERQLPYLEQYDYVMPVSIDIDNHTQLSWATRKKNGEKTTVYEELFEDWGVVMPFIFPFNGSLMSQKLVKKVGYVNPKLFIWGDDYEHYYRCLKAGFAPVTVLDALFYHPVNKAPTVPIMKGLFQIPYVESDLRFVCLIRNWAYINKTNKRYISLLKSFMAYTWLFMITQKGNFSKYKLFINSFIDGLINKFDRHKKYLSK